MKSTIPSIDILGVQINALTVSRAVETIEAWVERREPHYVCICAVHSIMEATRNPQYMRVLNEAGIRTADGMPLVWLSRKSGYDVERVCGPDLLPVMAARSAATGHRHYFYGGAPGVAGELARRLMLEHPKMKIAGVHTPGELKQGELETATTIDKINASGADIVWIGLGSPKQDIWAANHRDKLEAPVIIAVGAAFDFHSGRIKRAPKLMQDTGTEWLYRLGQDPKRLWRRYLRDNAAFTIRILFALISSTSATPRKDQQ